MDVRCERCETEYELEDESVSAEGTKVQCTSCGHTFEVRRPSKAMPVVSGADGAVGAEWLLDIGGGRVQRLRDLTDLQKWIIERKVMREDRISKTGQSWRRLGEIVELAPFFEVVDDADRGRVAVAQVTSMGAGALRAEAAEARRTAVRRTPAENQVARVTAGGRSSEILPVEAPSSEAEIDTAVVRLQPGGRWKLLVGLGVAAGVAYAGITNLPELEAFALRGRVSAAPALVRQSPAVAVAAPVANEPATESAGESAVIPSPGPTTAAETGAAAAPATAPAAAPEPTAGAGAAATSPALAASPPVESPAAAPPATASVAAAPATAPVEPSYDRLVSEGDRLLENGAAGRALKLYQRALRQQPSGAEALAGLGYVHLDRQRNDAAIAAFRRALSVAPFAPAMFGMGEAYRAAGDRKRALEAYQRYLATSPDGPDAPAARRQVKTLTADEEANPVAPPASILQEGAR